MPKLRDPNAPYWQALRAAEKKINFPKAMVEIGKENPDLYAMASDQARAGTGAASVRSFTGTRIP